MKHLITEGDTDLFPLPFEISALAHNWRPLLRGQFASLNLADYAWEGGRRFVVPKSLLAFRTATQLDPLDSLIISTILHKYGPSLEASRLPIQERRVFSYRLAPTSDGRLYTQSPGWHDFWKTSLERSRRPGCGFVVIADIADFYNQVYHHVIERHLEKAKLPAPVAKAIKSFLQTLTDKVSRGVPVGPHASHILAECALDATDRSLLSHGYDFCRYVDDIHIFVSDEKAAYGALFDLAQILDSQQRLMLQNDKTKILSAQEFRSVAQAALVDRPASNEEKEILQLISTKTQGDPYRRISVQTLRPDELKIVSREVLERLLQHYLGQDRQQVLPQLRRVDYTRLSWLIRRLTQLGVPGALEFVLINLSELSPILGPVARYITSAVPSHSGDKSLVGEQIVRALDLPVIRKSPYLQTVLLDILAGLPELNHVDAVTSRYSESDPVVRREIVRVAGNGDRADWLRDRKPEFRQMDPWLRRAFLFASSALPEEESRFWLQSVLRKLTAHEKVVVRYAFRHLGKGKEPKLGQIEITK